MDPLKILVIDDEPVVLDSVSRILRKDGHAYDTAKTAKDGLGLVAGSHYDVVLLDLALPDMPGRDVLEKIVVTSPEARVVIITGHATVENAVGTLRMGASDFLAKPFSPDELRALLVRLARDIRLSRENELLRRRISGQDKEPSIVGDSPPIREVMSLVERVAPTESTVLILGESGTGKELIARAIHENSARAKAEFVPIDCTSLVESLLESELFGHAKGSFTGAVETKAGYLELAGGGTLFFDEVGNLPLSIQAKLLRVLQTRQFSPVGTTKKIPADVRVLAATNQNLDELIRQGRFREDLFYRLNVVPIRLPPLRRRMDDVPALVHHFVQRFNRRRTRPVNAVSEDAMALLQSYHWPGNIRELENTIERALILEDTDTLSPPSLPIQLARQESAMRVARPLSLAEMERGHISHILNMVRGNRSRAAALLGVDRKTLYNKIKKYDL